MKKDEHYLQVSIVKYLDLTQTFPFFSVPNGGLRHIKVAAALKAEGQLAGVADLFLMVSNERWHGIFMEVKFGKGIQTPNQKAFEKRALIHGYYYAVVRSIDDCKELLDKFKLNQI